MKTAAIICEYNPFHSGHKFHIDETKRKTGADAIIAVMSGNFVQRGDVAVFKKETRAKIALLNGADLVLELPARYSSASAEIFARSAASIINSLGIVDYLSFGAECEDLTSLSALADFFVSESPEFSEALKKHSANGLSFPAARAKSAEDLLGKDAKNLLSTPNNLLGIEYLKALSSLGSNIIPVVIPRTGAQHDSTLTTETTASATYIRSLISSGSLESAKPYIPTSAFEMLKEERVHSLKNIEKAILCCLINTPAERLRQIADVTEGLENRIKAAAASSNSLEELLDKVKTKRYTHSRLRRIMLASLLGITDEQRQSPVSYIKILDHNEKGRKLIAAAKKTAVLPIVRNTSQVNKLEGSDIKSMWEQERTFDSIYNLC
ncbi:MAG: nucleotidyltransferase [Clostridia bacterium]|nr:nucleotidyltransferase [Clostridia bacterium]